MKSFVFVALVAVLASVASYGPVRRNRHRGHRAPPSFQPSHGHSSFHHSSSNGPHHQSHYDYDRGPPHGHLRPPSGWYDSPEWVDRWDDRSESGESDSGSSETTGPLLDYGYWPYHFKTKRPCQRPSNSKSPSTDPSNVPPSPSNTGSQFQGIPTIIVSESTSLPGIEPSLAPTRVSDSTSSLSDATIQRNSSPPVTTTINPEEEFPTLSPEIESCIESCLTTPEYNPVCGTNGETYLNEGSLFCAKSCGVDVSLRRRSVCPPPIFDESTTRTRPTRSPTPPQTTTTTPNVNPRTVDPREAAFRMCMKQCQITAIVAPVCGTDLVTYMNMDRMKCAQSCGADVGLLCEKPCVICRAILTTPRPTTLLWTTPEVFDRSTTVPDVQTCVETCPISQEYNPVCGSNGVTYRNPGHLLCEQMCGVDVTAIRFSPCSPPVTSFTTSTAATPTTTMSTEVLGCIRSCPVTTEYNPVCGTDDLTYINIGNLECSKYCGLDVDLKYKSRCLDEFNDATVGSPSQTTPVLNTTNDEAIVSPSSTETTTSLFTSSTTTPALSTVSLLTTTEAPTSPTTVSPWSTSTEAPTSSTTVAPSLTTTISPSSTSREALTPPLATVSPSLTSTVAPSPPATICPTSTITADFTISSDILKNIFDFGTTQSTTTAKVANPEDDEDIDLDARFSNDTESASSRSIDK